MIKTLLTAGLAIGFLAFGCQTTHAASWNDEPASVTIRVADLDLATPAGARAMLRRIENAARRVCPSPSTNADLAGAAFRDACVKDTIDRSVMRLDEPMVTAAYRGPNGENQQYASATGH